MRSIASPEPYRCPACGAGQWRAAADYNGHAMQVCAQCSLLHTRERSFPVSQYEQVYSQQSAYREMIEAARRTAAGELGFRDLWWFKRMALRWIEREGKGRLLDVGCGPGTFLLVARERGWHVRGVEPTPEPALIAREAGLDVFNGVIEDLPEDAAIGFDAITSFEVLEHVSRPASILGKMRSLLRPGGRLLLSVPNLDDAYCLQQQIPSAVPPVHINFFNRRSLRAALEAAELTPLRFFTLPIPTSSVRNVRGKAGFLAHLPVLVAARMAGRGDGTTLLALATR